MAGPFGVTYATPGSSSRSCPPAKDHDDAAGRDGRAVGEDVAHRRGILLDPQRPAAERDLGAGGVDQLDELVGRLGGVAVAVGVTGRLVDQHLVEQQGATVRGGVGTGARIATSLSLAFAFALSLAFALAFALTFALALALTLTLPGTLALALADDGTFALPFSSDRALALPLALPPDLPLVREVVVDGATNGRAACCEVETNDERDDRSSDTHRPFPSG